MQDELLTLIGIAVSVLLVGVPLYFLPWLIGWKRSHTPSASPFLC